MNDVAVNPEQDHPLFAVSGMISEEQQCDHKGHWHICPGSHRIVRFCGGCGKSWWIPAKDETLSFAGEIATLEWEEIKEYAGLPPLPMSFYDDAQIFVDDDDIEDDDEEFPG